jgi:CRP/FNR family transcriptional regulator, anaerobic regulatory protein
MTEFEQHLGSYFDFGSKDLSAMAALFKPVVLQKGEFFLQCGKRCDQFAYIQSGFLRVFAETPEGEVTQWIGTRGYFMTDLYSFVFQTPSRWSMQAITDMDMLVISADDYNNIGSLIPQWSHIERAFLTKCFAMMEDRIFAHLSMSAEQRYKLFFEQNKELFNQVPLQYIASMLGMTPETFSRIRKKMLA